MAVDPFAGEVLKLWGECDVWDRRVGSYRIFFAVNKAARTVAITAITRRTSKSY
jgi:mRNA-degrading endonuclease RelE of RelBE toxin-antitoxin system